MNIVFVMSTSFPYGEAFSSRARNLTKLLCDCGHHVHIIAPRTKGSETCAEMDEFDYSCEYIDAPETKLTLMGIGTARPYLKALNCYYSKEKVDIVLSSRMVFVTDKILKFCNAKKIPYYLEQCEWFDESTFKGGKFNPYYREHIRLIEHKNRNVSGIIAISRLFEKHYSDQNVKTVRIPTILDINSISWKRSSCSDRVVHIVFAGSIGKGKEQLLPVFQALQKVNENGIRIMLDVYGPNRQQVLENIQGNQGLVDALAESVFIHGRIPQNEIEDVVRMADFSIFIRPQRRSSNAGFPTKLAESMAVGTPVITNNTGDIGLYLRNGENGFLLNNGTEDEIVDAFQTIISFNNEQHEKMRENARKTAEISFDYSVYVEKMKKFLNM